MALMDLNIAILIRRMGLQKIDGHDVRMLLLAAFEKAPSLVIDCANCANPHALFPAVPLERMHDVYVMNAEAIYRLRDTLRQVPYWARKLGVKTIVITQIGGLFSYDDKEENRDIIEHCKEIIQGLSEEYEVLMGVSGWDIQYGARG
jgi:hypothetical protein